MDVGPSKIAVNNEGKRIELDRAFHDCDFALVLADVCERVIGEPLMSRRVVRIQLESPFVFNNCPGIIEPVESFQRRKSSMGIGQSVIQREGFLGRALGLWKTISINEDPVPLGMLGRLYAAQGRKDEAQQILQRLRQKREQRYTAAYSLALVYLGLGDRNEALKWLEEGYRERDGFNIGPIRIDPLLTPLHGDPRFEALAEKIVPAREFAKAVAPK